MGQILHTRLILQCISLNDHLFRRNLVPSPLCTTCGCIESSDHFLLRCNGYSDIRLRHFHNLPVDITESQLIFGIPTENHETNQANSLTCNTNIIYNGNKTFFFIVWRPLTYHLLTILVKSIVPL